MITVTETAPGYQNESIHTHPAQSLDAAGRTAYEAMQQVRNTDGATKEPALKDGTIIRIADELPVFPEGVTVPEHELVKYSAKILQNDSAGQLGPWMRCGTKDAVREISEGYEDAYLQNTNPEALSRLEDLRMVTTEIFSRLNQLGLLPVEIDSERVSEIFNIPITKFSSSGTSFSVAQDSVAFATTKSPNSIIGTRKGIESLTETPSWVFIHEMVHAVLQSPSARFPKSNFPKSLMEATVQHIAERGARMFLDDPENKLGEVPRLSPAPDSRLAQHQARKKFNERSLRDGERSIIYLWERSIMYQLAPVEDFVAALCDADKVQDLRDVINRSDFRKGLGLFQREDIIGPLQGMIDGELTIPGFETQRNKIPSWFRARAVNALLLEARGKKRQASREREKLNRILAGTPEGRVA